MKQILLTAFISILIIQLSAAQSDTAYHFFWKDGREVNKDSAYSIMKVYKKDNQWYGLEVYKKNNVMKSEGNYKDSDAKIPVGSFNNYKENGTLDYTAEYTDGKTLSKTYFYKNGKKRSWIVYGEKGTNQQKGWDEEGKEIKSFVVEREATFKGGLEGWRKFLEKHLNANVAVDAGAPAGKYEVKVQFVISKKTVT